MKIGAVIRERRLSKGVSQIAFAELMGGNKDYINKLEQDAYSPTIRTLMRAAEALDTSVWRLIKQAEEPTTPLRTHDQ